MSKSDSPKEKQPIEDEVTAQDDATNEAVVDADKEPSAETKAEEAIEDVEDIEDIEDMTESSEKLPADELNESLAKATEEVVHFRDMALRAEAEMQNLRRRAEKDVANAHKYGIEKLLQNLLPVVDSLEKAVEMAVEAAGEVEKEEAVLEGVKICLKMLHELMAKEKIEILDPIGEPFDPKFHEAITLIEHPEMEPNSVVTVVQKGYRLNERLVRPAMVVVSKAAEQADKG